MAKKTLETLIRLERIRIDELRRTHNMLLDQQDHEQDAIDGISQALNTEKTTAQETTSAGNDYVGNFGAFNLRMNNQRSTHEANLERLEPEIEQSQTNLIDAFADRKRYEVINENKIQRALDEQDAKQQQEVDELTIVRFQHQTGL